MNSTIRTTLPVRVSALETLATDAPQPPAPPVLEFVASDETLDRYGEVISADGWDLGHYLLNPVFQNAHNYGSVIHTIGRALVTEVREGRLYQRIEFAVEANPLARIAYGLYRGGFLNAVSVGFVPLEWEDGTARTPWRRRYLRQELLEVSAVGIPANPNALMLSVQRGLIRHSDLREAEAALRSDASPALPSAPLDLLRTIRELMGNRQRQP